MVASIRILSSNDIMADIMSPRVARNVLTNAVYNNYVVMLYYYAFMYYIIQLYDAAGLQIILFQIMNWIYK